MFKTFLFIVVALVLLVAVLVLFTPDEIASGIEGTMDVTSDMLYIADGFMPESRCVSYDIAHKLGVTPDINPCR